MNDDNKVKKPKKPNPLKSEITGKTYKNKGDKNNGE